MSASKALLESLMEEAQTLDRRMEERIEGIGTEKARLEAQIEAAENALKCARLCRERYLEFETALRAAMGGALCPACWINMGTESNMAALPKSGDQRYKCRNCGLEASIA